jgi:hypothetical protein
MAAGLQLFGLLKILRLRTGIVRSYLGPAHPPNTRAYGGSFGKRRKSHASVVFRLRLVCWVFSCWPHSFRGNIREIKNRKSSGRSVNGAPFSSEPVFHQQKAKSLVYSGNDPHSLHPRSVLINFSALTAVVLRGKNICLIDPRCKGALTHRTLGPLTDINNKLWLLHILFRQFHPECHKLAHPDHDSLEVQVE